MKILHIDTERGFRGGELQVLLLMEGLKRKGHENFLVAAKDSLLTEKAESLAESIFTPTPESPALQSGDEWLSGSEFRPSETSVGTHKEKKPRDLSRGVFTISSQRIFDIINIFKICKFIEFSQADILHLHTAHAHLIGGIAGRMKCRPIVVTRRVDFPIKNRFKYNRLTDKIIAISQAVERVLIEGGVREDKIIFIPSGIDTRKFDSVKETDYLYREFKIPEKSLVIGTIAHLTDHKGHIYLLQAIPKVLKEFPNSFFLFVGDGELKESLKRKAQDLGVADKIIFTGFREDIPEILSILDLFVLPSHLEGLCTSLMDAMYMEVPVVATTAGGIPELIENGKTGLLVPPKDSSALAEAIIQLLRDETKREAFTKEGKKRVLQEFTASQMVERVEEVYLSVFK